MRLRLQVLAAIATLFVSAHAASDSVAEKTFTVVSPDSNDTLEGLYVQSEGRKFLILYDDSNKTGSEESAEHSIVDDGSSYEGETSSDGSADQEERAGAIRVGTVTKKVKKVFPKEYNTLWNKALYYLFQKLTPKNRRIPPS
ncbi:hypothetical protein PRIC1_015076 [Phytophthora ramorum]|uniref:uncharacterized protein n=1 Tax=Phytophthora ramorum TaxID=164328 RepID=UPI0030B65726|nr:hypothetical protein KRP23_8076 [Phytophthora ramorum]KAH7495223.1 hypothetical protein KRP22_14838 [Phytophthora ramorum]KAH7497570.1 hypothetical protein KRP22_12632 [Phytophthora ramorum]